MSETVVERHVLTVRTGLYGQPVFSLPALMQRMIDDHRWPLTEADLRGQNLRHGAAHGEVVRALAPDQDQIHFSSPPFQSVSQLIGRGDWMSSQLREACDLGGRQAGEMLVFGDFDIGSDAVIVLDYATNPSEPEVWRLAYRPNPANTPGPPFPLNPYWQRMTTNFAELIRALGLEVG